MTNTIAKQTLADGERNLVVKVHITGDASGDEAATQLIDVSSYNANTLGQTPAQVRIMRIHSIVLNDFDIQLLWDATTDDKIVEVNGDTASNDLDYSRFGGLYNPESSGFTGDIMFTTTGLGSEDGSFIMEMIKKY